MDKTKKNAVMDDLPSGVLPMKRIDSEETTMRMSDDDTFASSARSNSGGLDEPVAGGTTGGDAPSSEHHDRQKLGVIPLAVMVFYGVSGGPFGIESSVRSGGYFVALVGYTVMPFVWSLQEALMTAELGTALPESSGGVAWVDHAFGQKWGFMAGFLGWVAGATDNAIYPVLFLEYVLQAFFPQDDPDSLPISPLVRFLLLSSVSIILGIINWMGLPIVGHMSVGICLVAMSPFIVLMLVGSFKVDPSRWLEMPEQNVTAFALDTDADDDIYDISGGFLPNAILGGVLWRPFLNNMFWNLNSFDAAGSFAEDIQNPSYVLPKAMMWSVFMVIVCYLGPLVVAIGASDADQHDWVDGYLARITTDVVGPWLGAWTVFAAGISNIALFQAELSADALQLKGMADRGYLPNIFSQRSKHGTPTYGILLGVTIIVVMGVSNLDQLIEMLNFNYSVSLLMEYAAFIKLRISKPDMERPYRIPLNTFGCCLFFLPTVVAILATMVLATYTTLLFSLAMSTLGYACYRLTKRYGRNATGNPSGPCSCQKQMYEPVGSAVPPVSAEDGIVELS